MDDKRWIELAKRKKQDKYFGFISLLIVIMMVFFTVKNIGWLLTFIVVAVILYFWIDVEQMLEDSKVRKDLKNKNLKFADSMIATFLGIVVASLVVALAPRDILWLFLLIFALAYNLLHLIVRIKVEHDGTNREL